MLPLLPPLLAAAFTQGTNLLKAPYKYMENKYNYVRKLDKNFEKLENEADHLHVRKVDVMERTNRMESNMEITEECKSWLLKVGEIEDEVDALKTRYQNSHKFLGGLCPFRTLLKLGRDIVQKTDELRTLKDRMKSEDLMIPKKPEAFDLKLAEAEDIIPSLSENVEKLLTYLRDEEVRRVGIWGMPGVGKTTIMTNLNDKVSRTGMFENVIWVNAEEEDTITKIQRDIVAWLHLPVQAMNSQEKVAATISRALKNLKYLLLIDQVSSDINLSEVGIRNNHEHGKVVIASRCRFDCNRMDLHALLNVERLSNTDALTLFRKIVGDVADHPRIRGTAKRILKELGGLPQVIKAVATSLVNQDESVWDDALRSLQSRNESKLENLHEVFTAFNFLYNKLSSDDRKKCLLYGALFPKDYEIDKDYLIECWAAERFVLSIEQDGMTHGVQTLRAARDRGHTILQVLIDACLLVRCSRAKYVAMPAMFWMMALKIPYPQEEGCRSLVRAGEGLDNPPAEAEWRNAKRISFMCNKIVSLPRRPKCYQTSTLLLQRNKELKEIHNSFFVNMHELRVLDLSRTGTQSLPSSVYNLSNLKGLHVNNCENLVELSTAIGKLTNLEVLDVRHTGIRKLPAEIGQLGCLRSLRVGFSYRNSTCDQNHQQPGRMIPPGVIAMLSQLEELTVIVDPGDPSWNGVVDEVAMEVASLPRLTALFFYFPTAESLATFIGNSISWKNNNTHWRENSFRSFQFVVGSHEAKHRYGLDSSKGSVERHLRYSGPSDEFSTAGVREVLRQASAFELIGHQGARNLSILGVDCMESLEVCIIEECNQMTSIVKANKTSGIAFPFLEKLHMINLLSLNCIWEGPVAQRSLSKLSMLTLNGCPSLLTILSDNMVGQLAQLKHLRVENCFSVTDIIEADNQSKEVVKDLSGALPRLEILELVSLPALVTICENVSLGWRSLQKLEIYDCNSLDNLSETFSNARHLRKIKCCKNWWEELDLQDNRIKADLKQLCDFIPEGPQSAYGTPLDDRAINTQSSSDLHPISPGSSQP